MIERTDRYELEILRISLARIAQAAGVQTDKFPVLDKSYNELATMAKEDRGWNALAGEIVGTLVDRVHVRKSDAQDVVTALRQMADREQMGDGSYSEYLTELAKRTEAKINPY